MLGTVLGIGDMAVNETEKVPALTELTFSEQKKRQETNKQTKIITDCDKAYEEKRMKSKGDTEDWGILS